MKLFLLFVSLCGLGHNQPLLDCSSFTSCETCAGQSQGFLTCQWCLSSKACNNGSNCDATQTIPVRSLSFSNSPQVAFDCPRMPKPGFEFNDTFSRTHAFQHMAGSFSDTPQNCLSKLGSDFTVYKTYTVKCDKIDPDDTCFAFVSKSDTQKAIAITFRGTSGDEQLLVEVIETFGANRDFPGGGKLQDYFNDGFFLLWNASLQQDLLNLRIQYPDYQGWIFGHSLGGALAAICGSMMVYSGLWTGEQVRLVTFGEPRTGDIDFAIQHDQRLPYSYRVVHAHDLVPHIPPKMGDDELFHHRFEVWYNNDMKPGAPFTVCTRPDDDSCSGAELDIWWPDHGTYYTNQTIWIWGAHNCP